MWLRTPIVEIFCRSLCTGESGTGGKRLWRLIAGVRFVGLGEQFIPTRYDLMIVLSFRP